MNQSKVGRWAPAVHSVSPKIRDWDDRNDIVAFCFTPADISVRQVDKTRPQRTRVHVCFELTGLGPSKDRCVAMDALMSLLRFLPCIRWQANVNLGG